MRKTPSITIRPLSKTFMPATVAAQAWHLYIGSRPKRDKRIKGKEAAAPSGKGARVVTLRRGSGQAQSRRREKVVVALMRLQLLLGVDIEIKLRRRRKRRARIFFALAM